MIIRRLCGLIFALCVSLATLSASGQEAVQVYFGPKPARDASGVYAGLMAFLDDCEVSIYASLHEVDMIPVAWRLAERAEAGVDVAVVLERQWWETPKNIAARRILEASPVKVYLDTKSSGLMHNKFFVGDGKRVWTGSTNLTETGFFYNPNNSVRVESPAVAANFTAEFEEQRAGGFGKRGSGAPNTPNPTVTVDDIVVQTLFSPEDSPVPVLVAAIDAAETQIDVLAFVFSSQELAEAMIRAHVRGVRVRVLLDNMFASAAATGNWRYVPARELMAAGATVRYDREQSKLHHKVIIIDKKVVVTGSFNLSANAAKSNDENLLIIHSASIGAQYMQEFERLWLLYDPSPARDRATEPTLMEVTR